MAQLLGIGRDLFGLCPWFWGVEVEVGADVGDSWAFSFFGVCALLMCFLADVDVLASRGLYLRLGDWA